MDEDIGTVFMFKEEKMRDDFYNYFLEKCEEVDAHPECYLCKALSHNMNLSPYFVVVTCRDNDFDYWDNWIVENIDHDKFNYSTGVWVKQQGEIEFDFQSKEKII